MQNACGIARAALTEYARLVDERLPGFVYGVYASGSCLVGDFELAISDVDFITVTRRAVGQPELNELTVIHRESACANPLLARMDGYYISFHDIATSRAPHICFRDGAFQSSQRLPRLALFQAKQDCACVWGSSLEPALGHVTWADVVDDMDYNINVYWASVERRPGVLLRDDSVSFMVLTLCRIYVTLECGEIMSKKRAAEYVANALPAEWKPLICEAVELYVAPTLAGSGGGSLLHRVERSLKARQFLRYMLGILRDQLDLLR